MTERENSSVLDICGLSKAYGKVQALNDVSFRIDKGEFVSIIGPSGSGKSTLLKILAGVEEATSGSVIYNGMDICELDRRRQDMVMVWQTLALFPHMSVESNVGFGLSVRREAKTKKYKRIAKALSLVGLNGKERRCIHELSGGEQQRVALARALVVEPEILLLDEPMGALDAHLRSQLQAQLRELHQETRITFIMVTHDQSEALALSCRIAVLNEGRIEQSGFPREVAREPKTPFVARFVGNKNVLPGRIVDIQDECISVATGIGELKATKPQWLPYQWEKGDSVAYVVDASRLKRVAEFANRISGIIEGRSVSGSLEVFRVRVGSGERLAFETYGNSDQLSNKMDDHVDLSWTTEDAYILPDERA